MIALIRRLRRSRRRSEDRDSAVWFRRGFDDVISRVFALDFSPRLAASPCPSGLSGAERDALALASDWNRIGGDFWKVIGRFENEHPEISRGRHAGHAER
jgi:hypothetical protein